MQFTVVGHSSLFVESEGTNLLVDPWLIGSCYWRSWWHYPPIGELEEAWLQAENIYLTHHHFDHFHYPSLRRLNHDATVYVPRFAVDFMAGELRDIGFSRIVEMPHGATFELGPTFAITSYQYGFDDSTLIAADNTATLANFNDCKIRGRALDQILARHGSPTFVFKNHSWAQGYPHCYTSPDPADLEVLSRGQYAADFIETVRDTKAAYAIPFASNVCLLHPETRQYNDIAITPFEVADAFARVDPPNATLVVMGPHDRWSAESGFACADWTEAFDDRAARVDQLADEMADKIEKYQVAEAANTLSFAAFDAHLGTFLTALPPGARFILNRPVAFEVAGDDEPYWVLDFAARQVRRQATPPPDVASIIRLDDGLLSDAIDKNILGMVHISMRLSVELAAGGINVDLMFWAFLALWEIGYLPVQEHFDRRTLGVVWRRRRELTNGVIFKLVGRGSLVDRMAANLMSDELD